MMLKTTHRAMRISLAPDPWVVGLGLAALLVGVFVPLIYFELFKAPARRAGPRQGVCDDGFRLSASAPSCND